MSIDTKDSKNNTGSENSGDCNSGDRNSGHYNSGNYNSGDRNSGHYNSGDCNSGDRNSGHYNSGDCNSGMFNSDEPKMRLFNRDSEITYTQFREQFGFNDIALPVTGWVNKENMTDEEKASVTGWETMGGYLKTLTYKEAWVIAWDKASEEQRRWYLGFPNFDSAVFLEITGIDTAKKPDPSLSGRTIKVEIDGKSYSAVIK
jgi:hypothetical protein